MTLENAPSSLSQRHYLENEIFISYSRRDKEFVQRLDAALRASNRNPWVDWEDIQPTEDWWAAIEMGIEGASTFVFIISPDSVASKVCGQEIEHAIRHNKRLVPILHREGFDMQVVHPAISRHNWLFFREADDFDRAFDKLITAIETDLIYAKAHTRLLVRAREWQIKEQDSSFLLRGRDLEEAEQWLTQSATKTPVPTDLHHQYIRASREAEQARQAVEVQLRRMTPQQYRNRQALLSKVKNYWVKGVLENSLQNRVLLELGLEERPDAIAHPWSLTVGTTEQVPKPIPAGVRVVALFDQLGEGRSLLILGEPGSGKTTTLLELTRDLLVRAEQGIDHRIPVVFNLSSWAGGRQTIADWLVAELNAKYQVPKLIGQTWVQEQQLLLLLDGLDEVRSDHRNLCVAALNFFQQQYGAEIVVCSRIKDYEELSKRLNFQTAIYVRSLTSDQIQHYLNHTGSDLAALKTLLEADTALQELAKSPLMLNIMTLAYQGMTATDLPELNLEERRHHLFDTFIDRMFQRRGGDERYSRSQTMAWLIWLAQRMVKNSQSVFLIEGLQPTWLQTELQKRIYQIAVEMLVGLGCGLSMGLFFRVLNFNLSYLLGLKLGLISGLLAGLLIGILRGFYAGEKFGLAAGIIAALIFGFTSVLFGGLQPLNMVIFGLILGIVFHRLAQPTIDPVDTIQWSWQKGSHNFVIATIWGLLAGTFLLLSRWMVRANLTLFCRYTAENLQLWTGSVLVNFLCNPNQSIDLVTIAGLLLLGIFVGLNVALVLAFRKVPEVETRIVPNHGIRRSARNALKLMVLVGPLAGLFSGLVWLLYYCFPSPGQAAHGVANAITSPLIWWIYYGNQPQDGLFFGFSIGLMVGLLAGIVGGSDSGIVCLKHLVLRIILWAKGYMPWNYARFLNHACKRILLQKVGGGYIFIHRLLLEHFAQLQPQDSTRR